MDLCTSALDRLAVSLASGRHFSPVTPLATPGPCLRAAAPETDLGVLSLVGPNRAEFIGSRSTLLVSSFASVHLLAAAAFVTIRPPRSAAQDVWAAAAHQRRWWVRQWRMVGDGSNFSLFTPAGGRLSISLESQCFVPSPRHSDGGCVRRTPGFLTCARCVLRWCSV